MVPSIPLLSCESLVSVRENPDRKKRKRTKQIIEGNAFPKSDFIILIAASANHLENLGLDAKTSNAKVM